MDGSGGNTTAKGNAHGWLGRITKKSAAEVATEATLLVMGAALMYALDPLLISRAPVAFQYVIQFLAYINRHAISVVIY